MKIHWLLLLIFVAAVTTALLLQYRSLVGLRAENESLRQQLNQLARLQSEYERASTSAAKAANSEPDIELLRLRAEVNKLNGELKRQAARNERDRGDLQAPQQTTLPTAVGWSNDTVTWLNTAVGPDALSRGTVTLLTNKSGRTMLEYQGTNAEGRYINSFSFGPKNQ